MKHLYRADHHGHAAALDPNQRCIYYKYLLCCCSNCEDRLHASDVSDRQFWTRSWRRPSRGGEGTSPKTWMTMTCTDIASGLSLDGTDHSTTAVLGACSATPILLLVFVAHMVPLP